ncbi:hypothetical protein AB6A40_000567 [Gnathostoma spinigerum]|uniref:MYND-type domain-containing protein n=1 Tax=Gnathostoma spinigerum TaxID=75299 RepID=A0ABD6EAS7_9BILA
MGEVATAGISSVYERVKIFDNPFAYVVQNGNVGEYCSHCLRIPKDKKLYKCANCEFAQYCDKNCQRLAWKFHRNECRRLKKVFPNLPLTEVLFLSRIIDRVLFLETHGDKYGWERNRKWAELLGHQIDIRNDEEKYKHFEKIYDKMKVFRGDEMIDREKFFDIFCKSSINSHSIHSNAGDDIGLALDLGVSAYDHCCRPNCSLVFDGFIACLRPLIPEVNAGDPNTAFISYIDVGRSRYRRRAELKSKWYFECQCERCCDPEDDILTSIKCQNEDCDNPIITTEDAEPVMIACSKCKRICDEEYVKKAQQLMLNLPARFSLDADVKELRKMLEGAEKILHWKNIYITRLQTAIMHLSGSLKDNLPFMQEKVYANYKQCFPAADRHMGFQLLHIARAHIEKGERTEALPYAYEAMSIFEVCFGMEHPYYLQTLALWTYLDTKADKTNDELIALMNFHDNRPINVVELLAQNENPKIEAKTSA